MALQGVPVAFPWIRVLGFPCLRHARSGAFRVPFIWPVLESTASSTVTSPLPGGVVVVSAARLSHLSADRPSPSGTMVFRLADYDCIGFDLDNTVARYHVGCMFPAVYEGLARFLVENKGYDPELLRPIDEHKDFLQKGLLLDIRRGNLLKVGLDGVILRASHGTRLLSESEIAAVYGSRREWQALRHFHYDMFEGYGKLARAIRSFKDYFDLPAALLSARIVDLLDRRRGKQDEEYTFWADVLDALIDAYKPSQFAINAGSFFPVIRERIDDFVLPCSDDTKKWLRGLGQKKKKLLFLATGSHVDYASLVAARALGDDWRGYFDIVLTHCRKPGFFTGHRPFLRLKGAVECDALDASHLQRHQVYSQGNFQDLRAFMQRLVGKGDPKVVYFGDNLIQDVFTPAKYTRCHTVAVVEEMSAEGLVGRGAYHPQAEYLTSKVWGSFFYDDGAARFGDATVSGVKRINTLWADTIRNSSQLAIPDLEAVVHLPWDEPLTSFDVARPECPSGFFPSDPEVLHD